MANEITLTASLSCYKSGYMTSAVGRAVTGLTFTMNGNLYTENTQLIGTTPTQIVLGSVGQTHWSFFKNLDTANFLTIRNGPAGADLIKLLAGECAFVPLLDGSNPYAVANLAPCYLEYLILNL